MLAGDRPGHGQQPADLPAGGHPGQGQDLQGLDEADEKYFNDKFATVSGLAEPAVGRPDPSRSLRGERGRLSAAAQAGHAVSAACARPPLAARLLRLPEHPDVPHLVLDGDARDRLRRSRSSNWTNYTEALDALSRRSSSGRSSTAARRRSSRFLIAYPLAYTIAFRGGRYKNLLLFLVIAPFFTSFLLRTLSWKIILGDDGILLGPLKDDRPPADGVPRPGHAGRGDRRHHLQLPAVHDAADLRLAREDRRAVEAADLRRGGAGGIACYRASSTLSVGGFAGGTSHPLARCRCRASSPGRC